MQAIWDNLSFSSQHLQTYPHLLHPFLLCYKGKDGPITAQRPSQVLKLSLSDPILFQTFHEIPAAKTAFFTTFLAQSIISPGKKLGGGLSQGNITCGRPWLWSPCRCLWFSGAGTQHRTTSLPSLHMPKRYLWPAWAKPSLIPLRWYLSHEPATDHQKLRPLNSWPQNLRILEL